MKQFMGCGTHMCLWDQESPKENRKTNKWIKYLWLKLLLTKRWKSKQYSVIKIQPKSSEFDIFLWAGPKKKGTFFFVIISLTALFNMQFFYRSILIVVGLLG